MTSLFWSKRLVRAVWSKSCFGPNRAGLAIVLGGSGAAGCRSPREARYRRRLREGPFMPQRFDPKFDVLPAAQQQIWNALAAAPRLGFVLYGGTAIFFDPSRSTKISYARTSSSLREQPCC